jgi:hypothetical protein
MKEGINYEEEFEDTKGLLRSRKLKKDKRVKRKITKGQTTI